MWLMIGIFLAGVIGGIVLITGVLVWVYHDTCDEGVHPVLEHPQNDD